MDWYHLDTSQLKCIHSVWEIAGLRNNCRVIHHFVSVSCLLHCATMMSVQWFVFLELLASKQRDLSLLWKVLCDQSSWTYSHVMLWVHKNRVHGSLFIVWVLYWVLFLLRLVRHVGALPKVVQGPCLVSRDNAYMGTWHKYHVMDASLSLLWQCWNHHLVTHRILLNL